MHVRMYVCYICKGKLIIFFDFDSDDYMAHGPISCQRRLLRLIVVQIIVTVLVIVIIIETVLRGHFNREEQELLSSMVGQKRRLAYR